MKKVLLSIAQIICFLILYQVITVGMSYLIVGITNIVQSYTIFQFQIILLMYETVTQTVIPLFGGCLISWILLKLFKRNITIFSFSVIAVIYLYISVRNVLNNIRYYGLLTMDTGIAIWVALIIGGSILLPLFGATGYKITKKESEEE